MRHRRWQQATGAFSVIAGSAMMLGGTPALAIPRVDASPSAVVRWQSTDVGRLPSPGTPGTPASVTAAPYGPVFRVDFTTPYPGDSPISGYQYSTDDGRTWSDVETTGTGPLRAVLMAQSHSFVPFALGHPYRIRVRAVNGQGPGSPSAGVEASLPPDAPGPPPGLTAVPRAEGGVLLIFGAPPDHGSPITGWEFTTDGGDHWAKLAGEPRPEPPPPGTPARLTAAITAESTGDGGSLLRPGREYQIRVHARNAVGVGLDSDTVAVTLPNPGAPAAPTGATAGPAGDDGIGVDFSAPDPGDSPITGYQYSTDDGRTWSDVATTGTGPLHAALDGESHFNIPFERDHPYRVRIRAVNGQGPGMPSDPTEVVLPSGPPGAPVGLRAVPDHQMISVTFGDAPDNGSTLFGYEYSTDDGGHWQWLTGGTAVTDDWRLTADINAESTGDGATPLKGGATYRVRLRAQNANATGPDSRTVEVTLPYPGTPAAPIEITAAPSGGGIGIDFSAPDPGGSPITGYQYSTDDGLTWSDVATTGSDPLHVVVAVESRTGSPLIRGKAYAVQVRAVNGRGAGAPSDPADVTLPPARPGAPGYGTA